MKTPRVLAHRGSSAAYPENTVVAFERAMAEGADGVELDVMRCASGEVIVFHDDDLLRLCGVASATRAQPWSALRALSVRGEPIPQLDEVLEAVGDRAIVNVELKTAPGWRARLGDGGLVEQVVRILRHHALGPRALVSSFDPFLVARFRRLAPELAAGLLFAADQAAPLRRAWAASWLGVRAVHPEAALVDEPRVSAWRRAGLDINVWTVDDPAEVRYLASLGVDALITNRPGATRAVLVSDLAREAS